MVEQLQDAKDAAAAREQGKAGASGYERRCCAEERGSQLLRAALLREGEKGRPRDGWSWERQREWMRPRRRPVRWCGVARKREEEMLRAVCLWDKARGNFVLGRIQDSFSTKK